MPQLAAAAAKKLHFPIRKKVEDYAEGGRRLLLVPRLASKSKKEGKEGNLSCSRNNEKTLTTSSFSRMKFQKSFETEYSPVWRFFRVSFEFGWS